MKNYLFFTLLFSLFFACKKDNTNTPAVVGKELEVSGMVIDFETGKPLEGVDIQLSYLVPIGIKNYSDFAPEIKAKTDSKGFYKFKFIEKDSISYWLSTKSNSFVQFDGNLRCECIRSITPLDVLNHASSNYNLTDTFYVAKSSILNLKFAMGKTSINDTLTVKENQIFNGKKIGNYQRGLTSNYKNYTPTSRDFKTLADRMTYLTWKLKSESVWHQDSIMTPFGKIVDYEIKY